MPGKQRLSFTPECTLMAAGVGVRLRPGSWSSSHDLSLSVLGSIVEQAFGLLPRLCFLFPGFLLLALTFGVVSLASDGGSLRWHHHPVFPRSLLV